MFRLASILVVFVICVSVLAADSNSPSVAPPAKHLKWMSFWEYDPASFQGWCNFGFTSELTQLNQGAELGLLQFFDVGQLFFVESWAGPNGTWAGYEMRTDYQQCWKVLADLAGPLHKSGHIFGFMMLDEACWNGVTIKELDTASKLVKKTFPDCPIYLNEAGGPFLEGSDLLKARVDYNDMPEAIDWISFDYYGPPASQVRQWYNVNVYPKLKSHQQAFLVPAAYGQRDGEWTMEKWEDFMTNNLLEYYAWANSDERVVGFAPWHWLSYPQGGNWSVGAKDMPRTRALWEKIGKMICKNNSPGKKLKPVKLVQVFDTIGDNEPLPSIYATDPWGGGKVTPAAPDVNTVVFSQKRAFSGKTSIWMKSAKAAFRYCWGTNDRNTARMFAGSPVQTIEFKVFMENADSGLRIEPLRGIEKPFTVYIDKEGIKLADANSTQVIAKAGVIKPKRWTRVKIQVETAGGKKATPAAAIWVNDNKIYDAAVKPVKDVVFTTVFFEGGAAFVDDIGMWGEY